MQQGIQEGLRQGQARLLTLQLSQRFGPLPDDIAATVAAAAPEQLLDWAKAVIEAGSLGEIFPRH